MKNLIITIAVAILLVSCGSSKHLTVQERHRDSVRIEYRQRTVFVPDTVFVEIPAQKAERTTKDSTSHLENDYASSYVRINSDGTLTHTLNSKPQAKPVPIKKPVEYRDSIVYKDKIINKKNTITKYVHHKRSWWEQTQIYGFWAAIIIFAITYRKKIFQTAMRLFFKK